MDFIKNNLVLKFLLALFISLNFSSCYVSKTKPPLPGIDNETVMWVVLPYALELQHEKKLHLEESVAYYGGDGNYIEKMRLNFTSQSILELREARELLVDVADGLIDSLNNDPELGPLISTYPLSTDNLEICIRFESYHGLYVDKAYVHSIQLQEGRSFFYAFDLTNEFHIWDIGCECWHERTEPFYKSRQIVTIQRAAEASYKARHPDPLSVLTNERVMETNKTDRANLPY